MQPDEIRAFVESLIDRDDAAVPRIWTYAAPVRPDDEAVLHRIAPSVEARTAGYDVGLSMQSPRPISKLFSLPAGASPAALRNLGALDLLLTDPVPVPVDATVILHACVLVTVGAIRATLVDTQRDRLYVIPTPLAEIVTVQRGATMAQLLDLDPELDAAWLARWFGVLVAEELAAIVDDPASAFPEIELRTSVLPFEDREVIDAIVDQNAGSEHDLASLAAELDELRCQHLQLRYFADADPGRIGDDLSVFERSRLRTIEVVAPWDERWTPDAIDALCAGHDRVSRVFLYGAPEQGTFGAGRYHAQLVTEPLSGHEVCGQVSPAYFSTALEMLEGAGLGDSCLRGKVGIDVTGAIRNCPSHPDTRGVLGVDRLLDVVTDSSFRAVGRLAKDDVDGCRSCEFRRVCSHCQIQADEPGAKPSTCTYDPTTGRWEE